MSSMNLKTKRSGPGKSVFWLIAALFVAIVVLLAVVVIPSEDDVADVENVAPSEMPTTQSEPPLQEPNDDVVENNPATETGTDAEAGEEQSEDAGASELAAEDSEAPAASEADDAVSDPDGGTKNGANGGSAGAVFPTPSGPEGADGDALTTE